jgi:putative ABC transport system permease protein
MKLTARLALDQIQVQKNRSMMTSLGIILSSAMLTAVVGFSLAGKRAIENMLGTSAYTPLIIAAFTIIGTIFAAIIIAASVIVVSNAFRVSAGERTRQFGMLKSVGATKKQIASSVMYEALFLSLAALPAGLVIGLLVEFIGVTVANGAFQSLYDSGAFAFAIVLPFAVSPLMFILSIAVSLGAVMLSAWLPARKAAAIAAIEAIRATGEVKVRNVKTSRLTALLFGFEGSLAAKSIKRSRRNFRATVLSLSISIALIVMASAFGSMMNTLTDLIYDGTEATVAVHYKRQLNIPDEKGDTTGSDGKPIRVEAALTYDLAERVTAQLREYQDAEIYGGGQIAYGTLLVTEDMASGQYKDYLKRQAAEKSGESGESGESESGFAWPAALGVNIAVLDARDYAALCQLAGVPLGSNIYINHQRIAMSTGYVAEFAPLNGPIDALTIADDKGTKSTIRIDAVVSGGLMPAELPYTAGYNAIIVPEGTVNTFTWRVNAADNAGFAAYAEQVLSGFARTDDEYYDFYSIDDMVARITQQRTVFDTIMFFVYGFVGMLALIAVTSVISTVSTNIRSRSREFAVLQSVGMTKAGIRKMLNLESVMSSARSLLFGLPLGLLGAYGVYNGMDLAGEISFSVPWLAVAECVAGIFLITWVTMRVAANWLNSDSIIETIRGTDGV